MPRSSRPWPGARGPTGRRTRTWVRVGVRVGVGLGQYQVGKLRVDYFTYNAPALLQGFLHEAQLGRLGEHHAHNLVTVHPVVRVGGLNLVRVKVRGR